MKKVHHWLLSSGIVLVGSVTFNLCQDYGHDMEVFFQNADIKMPFSQITAHADDVSLANSSSSSSSLVVGQTSVSSSASSSTDSATSTSTDASSIANNDSASSSVNSSASSLPASDSSSASSAQSSSASSTNSASSSSASSSSAQPIHHYDTISSTKKVNFDVNLKHGVHKAYQGGPKNTSVKNVRSKYIIKGSRTKTVHITDQATVKGVKWFKADGHWIKESAIDQNTHYLRVPVIGQRPQLPTGCEITAVTMMLKYKGAKVNKMMLANKMPRSSNPNKGFIGNPKSPAGQLIYPGGLMNLVKNYAGSAKNMTGASMNQIKHQIAVGKPVVIWVANMDNFPNHALTVYGYNHDVIYYNDPWINKRAKMSTDNLQIHRRNDALRAISY